MDGAARVLRASFDERLPSLAGIHTPAEDRAFFREQVFPTCQVWGAFEDSVLIGVVAFRPGWLDHLYILPVSQGRGIGSALLNVAMAAEPELQLWTFQQNEGARAFYERRGFTLVRMTDGAENEEREPDVLYRWRG
jgi:putative acetyltransferase